MQASQRDLSEGLTEQDLMALGEDVGIPTQYLQQALVEETSRTRLPAERGMVAGLFGPKRVGAARRIEMPAGEVRRLLEYWMTDVEMLVVKRRLSNGTAWEPRGDVFSSIRRSIGSGGKRYDLSRAREVAAQVSELDAQSCFVTLVADMSNTFNNHAGAAAAMTGFGAISTVIAGAIGVIDVVAALPLVAGGSIGLITARARRPGVERVYVGLERVLDKLEHKEIKIPKKEEPRGSAIQQIADEVRKGFKKLDQW